MFRNRAFTLIELVITLMVIGVLAVVVTPRFSRSLQRTRAEAAARRIAADLRYTAMDAEAGGSSHTVTFFPAEGRYVAATLPDLRRPERTLDNYLQDTPYPARLASADFGGSETVTFDMYGRPDHAGAVTVSEGGFTYVVSVDALGNVEVTP
jgi:prepilin-type N-terminal cleavage/methylation domain-containing protein